MSKLEQFPLALLLACHVGGFACVSALSQVIDAVSQSTSVIYRAVVLFMSIMILIRLLSGSLRVASSGVGLTLALIWAAMLMRLVLDVEILNAQAPRVAGEYLLITIGACLIPMLAMSVLPQIRTLETAWLVSAVLCSIASLVIVWLLIFDGLKEWGMRLATDVLNPITVGYLGSSLVVLVVSAPPGRRIVNCFLRAYSLIVRTCLVTLGLFVAVASGSRGPILALVLSLLVFGVMSSQFTRSVILRRVIGFFVAAAVAIAVTVSILLLGQGIGVAIIERFLWLRMDDSTIYRQQAIEGALRQFLENPLFGSALLERSTMDHPHNLLVEALMSTGLMGGGLLLIFLGFVFRSALVLIRDRPEARWLGMLCLMQLVASITSGSLFLSDSFWTLSVATLSAASRRSIRLIHRCKVWNTRAAIIRSHGGVHFQ